MPRAGNAEASASTIAYAASGRHYYARCHADMMQALFLPPRLFTRARKARAFRHRGPRNIIHAAYDDDRHGEAQEGYCLPRESMARRRA